MGLAGRQFQGSNSATRLAGCSAIRASVREACGLTSGLLQLQCELAEPALQLPARPARGDFLHPVGRRLAPAARG